MVKISELLLEGTHMMQGIIDLARLEAEAILSHLLCRDRLWLSVHRDDVIPDNLCTEFRNMCKRRADGEPTAYILGKKEFMSMIFNVNPGVLIPRPETEMLVEYVADKYQNIPCNIIDICTGSGAIACAVAHYLPLSKVTGADISDTAIKTAVSNADKHALSDRVHFIKADALSPIDTPSRFHVAVSNPPYIESAEVDLLESTVKDFEPRLALDGGEDGLIFYKQIVHNIDKVLIHGGELIFEIGYNQGEAVKNIMETKFKNVTVYKDMSGLDRMVCGQLA